MDKILKGAKPADLPVEQPTKFELVINLKTAKALGLTIPPIAPAPGGSGDRVMDRRAFLGLAGVLSAPLAASAQQAVKVHRVGLIFPSPPVSEMAGPEPVNNGARAFVQGLRALGYVEGRNLILERRSAEGRFERFAPIVGELLSLNVEVIVVSNTGLAQRARERTTTVPIVMGAVADPVGSGLVQSLARPGGNVTGLTQDVGPEILGKRLELLKRAVPRASRVAFLGTRELWDFLYEKSIKASAQALGLSVFLAEHTPTDYTGAFTLIRRERADTLLVAHSSENYAQRRLIADFATSTRLPSIHAFRESVEVGGLMSYGANVADLFRRAATYVDKILKGAKPADLPVEQPTKFELVINLKTAKALGLTIPQSLLLRADQVIE